MTVTIETTDMPLVCGACGARGGLVRLYAEYADYSPDVSYYMACSDRAACVSRMRELAQGQARAEAEARRAEFFRLRDQLAWGRDHVRGPVVPGPELHTDPHGEAFYAALNRGEWMGPGR